MNIKAFLLLAVTSPWSRCGAHQQLRIGELAIGQLNPQDRGDTTARILVEDYSNQFAMIVIPEATGYEASDFYLQEITTLIDRATTVFKTKAM